jgi:hypothetical protein
LDGYRNDGFWCPGKGDCIVNGTDDDDTVLVRFLLLSASKSDESLLRFGTSKLRTVSVDMVGAIG